MAGGDAENRDDDGDELFGHVVHNLTCLGLQLSSGHDYFIEQHPHFSQRTREMVHAFDAADDAGRSVGATLRLDSRELL
jgi:hypothetical protein